MKTRKEKIFKYIAVNISVLAAVSLFANCGRFAEPMKYISEKVGSVAASAVIPGKIKVEFNDTGKTSSETVITAESDAPEPTQAPVETTSATAPTEAAAAEKNTETKAVSGDVKGKISVEKIGTSGANLAYGNVHISNSTGVDIDLKKQLSIKPDINIIKDADKSSPQVLIVHTHGTEAYFPKEADSYLSGWTAKSTNENVNVVSVGTVIEEKLEKAGIRVLHDKTQYDKQAYSGSYARCRPATKANLDKYPSIDVVLDIHRDAITYDSGTKLKPTAEINGKKAAQLMIATGCESGKVTGYPDWIYNFRFAARLQQSCETKYPGLARPMYFVSKKYNHDLCRGSILIEMGSEANTLEEAKYSGELLADALIDVLLAKE